ncbi:hypothetical protein [Cohnella sp.]|uniref:hypothetical protein n=1 Tax=Cohnella sp. TaxID=1883426 RepID=UPI00356B5EC1
MAFDLTARLRLIDGMSSQLRRVNNSLISSIGTVGKYSVAIGAIGAAYASTQAAAGLFNKTIKAAANYEMKEVTVNAMFGKNHLKSAKEYFDLIESRSAASMFSQDDFLEAGKSFIPTTKDTAQIAKMVNLAERLGAIDPAQGLTGASYALKEFFGGDAVSLVERFELPRKAMNEIKNLPLSKQLKALDKYLDGIGATNDLINAQSATTIGQYKKSVASINKAFREMGTEGLAYVNPLLEDFNKYLKSTDFQRFKTTGIRVFGEFSKGVADSIRSAGNYINSHFLNNPAFQNLKTPRAKVGFIFDDIMATFNGWLNAGGRDSITKVATDAINLIGGALKASEPLIDAAKGVGIAVGQGMLDGMKEFAKTNAELAALMTFMATPGSLPVKLVAAGAVMATPGVAGTVGDIKDPNMSLSDKLENLSSRLTGRSYLEGKFSKSPKQTYDTWNFTPPAALLQPKTLPMVSPESNNILPFTSLVPGFASGLDNVPYDNFPARLHAGETVLTRTEATAYREGNGGNSGGSRPLVMVQNLNVRNDGDIDKIAGKLAHLLAM